MGALVEQLAWDLDDMIAEVNPAPARAPYAGRAPLHFTVEVYTLDEFARAWDEYIEVHGHFNCIRESHMWHLSFVWSSSATPGHAMQVLSADLGPAFRGVDRAVCECNWASEIVGSESTAVEQWHDHAWPGWREQPIVPEHLRTGGGSAKPDPKLRAWLDANLAPEWQRPGAPIITDRGGQGNRHVPGYSPWGGYDISHTALHRTGKA